MLGSTDQQKETASVLQLSLPITYIVKIRRTVYASIVCMEEVMKHVIVGVQYKPIHALAVY